MERPTDNEPANDAVTEDDTAKDLLRGGSGERGVATDPATNDDLLSGGSGILPPRGQGDDDPVVRDDRGEASV
jgi:hypothetical protein